MLDAGLAFIGPSPRWLDAMGHKTRAKDLMRDYGMPMCPSSAVLAGSAGERLAQAAAVGFPLLVKPAGGGGGIGMLPANDEAALAGALERAASLAERSFGNGELYVDTCINDAIALGLKCRLFEIDHYLGWGTPDDLRTFEYWQACFHKWASHPYRLEHDPRVPAEARAMLAERYQAVKPPRPSTGAP